MINVFLISSNEGLRFSLEYPGHGNPAQARSTSPGFGMREATGAPSISLKCEVSMPRLSEIALARASLPSMLYTVVPGKLSLNVRAAVGANSTAHFVSATPLLCYG